jgi:hypothetical protein
LFLSIVAAVTLFAAFHVPSKLIPYYSVSAVVVSLGEGRLIGQSFETIKAASAYLTERLAPRIHQLSFHGLGKEV